MGIYLSFERGRGFGWFELLNTRQVVVLRKQSDGLLSILKGGIVMAMVWDAGHIFHHYLENSIPEEEWQRMSVEEALGIAKDVAALFDGTMSAIEFSKKYRLPRRH